MPPTISRMYQVVVQSFPDPNGGKWQITAQGGIEPKWRRDGRELYYLAFDGKLMSVPVKVDRVRSKRDFRRVVRDAPLAVSAYPGSQGSPLRRRGRWPIPDGRACRSHRAGACHGRCRSWRPG